MNGSVGILNVGTGDTKLKFDKDNPAECIRAGRIVKDMLSRGYMLLVETEPDSNEFKRALGFDENTCEYIIADFDPMAGDNEPEESIPDAKSSSKKTAKKNVRKTQKRTSAKDRKAVAVSKISGG